MAALEAVEAGSGSQSRLTASGAQDSDEMPGQAVLVTITSHTVAFRPHPILTRV